MYAQHHTIVNQVRIPKRKTPRNTTHIQQIKRSTNNCLLKIKRPFLAARGKIFEKKVVDINTNTILPTSKEANVAVTIVDTTHSESVDALASEVQAPVLSLDPQRSKFPTELRLKIWKMCWEPRFVEVHHYVHNRGLKDIAPLSSATFRSAARPPVTLHICSESRIETLKYYCLAFAAKGKPPEVYFNFDLDCLYLTEADMFQGMSFASKFLIRDLKRLQRLAVTDRYIQHLIVNRQRNPPPQHVRPTTIAYILLQSDLSHLINLWESLKEVGVVVDGLTPQREDRTSSWMKEGVYVCVHCVAFELQYSFGQWKDSPNLTVESYSSRFRRLELNSEPPEKAPIIRRQGHLIYSACCRLRTNDLLETLRELDNPPDKPRWSFLLGFFGFTIWRWRCPGCLPCRCRLENYVLSMGLATYVSGVLTFNRRKGGELGNLCKKWLQYTNYIQPR